MTTRCQRESSPRNTIYAHLFVEDKRQDQPLPSLVKIRSPPSSLFIATTHKSYAPPCLFHKRLHRMLRVYLSKHLVTAGHMSSPAATRRLSPVPKQLSCSDTSDEAYIHPHQLVDADEDDDGGGDYWHPPPPARGHSFYSSEDLDESTDFESDDDDLCCERKEATDFIATSLSIELFICGAGYAQALIDNESYLRDAILKGMRYHHDYCLEQNVFRFKSKLCAQQGMLWRWKSYDAYIRRSNTYYDELDHFVSRVKRELLPNNAWRARPASTGRYLWHDGEFASFSADAVRLIDTARTALDYKYPIRTNLARGGPKRFASSVCLSRAAFIQRDRTLFALFKNFLTAPVHDAASGTTVALPERTYHAKIRQLDQQGEGNPCLVYAATDILRQAPDVSRECLAPRHLPGLRSNCCQARRGACLPWYSDLVHTSAPCTQPVALTAE